MAAEAAVGFLLERLAGVVVGYADLISGADEQFRELQEDLRKLNAKLQDMSNDPSESVRLFQNDIRNTIYQVEDTIDICLTDTAARKDKGKIIRTLIKWVNVSLASRVKSLRKDKVHKVLDEANGMTFDNDPNKKEQARGTETERPLRRDKVVGFEGAEDIIINHLTTVQKELDIIPITGMCGLGKTTLAGKIYHDDRIRTVFTKFIWVHVSERFNINDVFLNILNQTNNGEKDESKMDAQALFDTVRRRLTGERFLLVLDDVWETAHWDAIKDALPSSNWSSKVLVTSRHKNVGRHVARHTIPHELLPLGHDEGWKLLQLAVFDDLEKCPLELRAPGTKIARQCKGMPLTILLIGGVLKDHYGIYKSNLETVIEKWEETADNVSKALQDQQQVMIEAVKISHDSLPNHLKECFLYLGVFPEGYEIPTWTLKCLWIAEGFIKFDEERSYEETAEVNLNYLISRNLLMPKKTNTMQEVKVCLVHDMIRMYCKSVGSKQKLFEVPKILENEVPDQLVSGMGSIRRLCLHSNLSTFFSSNLPGPHVRSFLSFQEEIEKLVPEHNEVIFKSFLLLRILQFKSLRFEEFPKSVIKLRHLRYIVLYVDNLTVVPASISHLWNLQTIIVDTSSSSDSIIMEANIWKMVQLRHVKTNASIDLTDIREGAGQSKIQILNRLSPKSVSGSFSQKASKLKTLGIRGELSLLFANMSLEKLNHLKKLKLYHVTKTRLQHFPSESCFPPNLERLTLSNTSLGWEHMRTIAKMFHLKVLKLKNNAFKGLTWDAKNCVYENLQFLLIATTELLEWKAPDNAFPRLKCLVFKDCKDLDEIPKCVVPLLDKSESQLSESQLVRFFGDDNVRNSVAQF